MTPPAAHPLKADLVLFITALIAAAGWVFSKETLTGLPPLLFVGTRFLAAGMILSGVSLPQLRALDRRALGGALVVGGLFSVAMAFWIMGLAHSTHLGEGAFIYSLSVVFVPAIARLFFGERPPLGSWLALPIALTGFACLSLGHGFRIEPGHLFFLGSALIGAVQFNLTSRVLRKVPALALGAVQMLIVGASILPAALLLESWPDQVSVSVLGWLAASILIASALRFFLQLHGQSLTTPSHAAILLLLEPLLTAIAAAWWYGESMSALQLAGCLLIFVSLLASRWSWVRGLLRSIL